MREQPSDNFLASDAQLGDDRAAEQLILRYRDAVVGKMISLYFLPGHDREDVAAIAMFGFLKAIRTFDPGRGSTFRSFAYLCAEREVQTAMVAEGRQKHRLHHESISLARPVNDREDHETSTLQDVVADRSIIGRNPADVVTEINPLRELRAASDGMSEIESTALVAVLDGDSYQDVADRLDVPLKSIDNATQRARRKFGRYLDAA